MVNFKDISIELVQEKSTFYPSYACGLKYQVSQGKYAMLSEINGLRLKKLSTDSSEKTLKQIYSGIIVRNFSV